MTLTLAFFECDFGILPLLLSLAAKRQALSASIEISIGVDTMANLAVCHKMSGVGNNRGHNQDNSSQKLNID